MSGSEYDRLGWVKLDPDLHAGVAFRIGDEKISAALPLTGDGEDLEHAVGIDEVLHPNGDRERRYIKLPPRLREAGHAVVEFYDSHENLKKGVKAVSAVAGLVAVGSLVVLRLKTRRS